MKSRLLSAVCVCVFSFGVSAIAQAATVSIGLTVNTFNDLHNAETLAASYDPGSSATLLNSASFNALSTVDLLASYDLLVVSWQSDSAYNLDWNTVLLPYISGGGAVIFEDPNNTSDLAGSGLTFGGSISPVSYNGEFGPNSFTTAHLAFTTSGTWDCFYTSTDACLGAKNTFGSGAIIVTGPDEFYHDNDTVNDAYLRAEADYVLNPYLSGTSAVPIPAAVWLFGSGLLGLVGVARRKKAA